MSRKVFLKHQIDWNTVCGAIRDLPWRNIWLSDKPVEVLNEHILSLLVGRFVPTKIIRVHNKDRPDLMINAGMLLASSLRLIFGGPVIALDYWEEFVRCQVRANETYSEAKCQFSDSNRDVLMNVHSPHKWWSTLKSTVFSSSEGGGLVCESVAKADLLSDYFDS